MDKLFALLLGTALTLTHTSVFAATDLVCNQVTTGDIHRQEDDGSSSSTDIVAFKKGGRQICLFENLGEGQFRHLNSFTLADSKNIAAVAVGDVVGDSSEDLVVLDTGHNPHRIRIFKGVIGRPVAALDATSEPWQEIEFPSSGTLVVTPVDNDDKADIVVGQKNEPALGIFKGDLYFVDDEKPNLIKSFERPSPFFNYPAHHLGLFTPRGMGVDHETTPAVLLLYETRSIDLVWIMNLFIPGRGDLLDSDEPQEIGFLTRQLNKMVDAASENGSSRAHISLGDFNGDALTDIALLLDDGNILRLALKNSFLYDDPIEVPVFDPSVQSLTVVNLDEDAADELVIVDERDIYLADFNIVDGTFRVRQLVEGME